MKNKNLTSLSDLIDNQYGKTGEKSREEFEQDFEAFRIGYLLKEIRKKEGLTQEQVAKKCGTNKSYISRIENDSSDLRVSTLIKILRVGLNKNMKFI